MKDLLFYIALILFSCSGVIFVQKYGVLKQSEKCFALFQICFGLWSITDILYASHYSHGLNTLLVIIPCCTLIFLLNFFVVRNWKLKISLAINSMLIFYTFTIPL